MIKKITKLGIFLLTCFVFFISTSFYVFQTGNKYIINNAEDLPETDVVIILGAKVYDDKLSQILADRADTAIDIYKLQKAKKILVSGDHGSKKYDEVNAIKTYLLKKDIPSEDIFLDHAGFNTYNSMYRANYIFGVKSAIISTQEFHLPRSLYLARSLGIDAYGLPADKRAYTKQSYNNLREFLARIKAWLNITFKKSPKYLGEQISLDGDSQESWDIKEKNETNLEIKLINDEFISKLVSAAILQTKNKVFYDPSYFVIDYPGGDIPSDKGVCTDVVIRAYRQVGIDLQEKVHEDMKENFHLYPNNWGLKNPDPNIDHRRVPNLQTLFTRFGNKIEVSNNPNDYNPGDIVVWKLPNGLSHIGLVSNYYYKEIPLIVHNIGAGPQLENTLLDFEIISHYRYR